MILNLYHQNVLRDFRILEFLFVLQGLNPFYIDSLMGAPSAMVSFYPDIPEVETTTKCGEFVFLMDRSRSMNSPMSSTDKSQLRIDAAKVKQTH